MKLPRRGEGADRVRGAFLPCPPPGPAVVWPLAQHIGGHPRVAAILLGRDILGTSAAKPDIDNSRNSNAT